VSSQQNPDFTGVVVAAGKSSRFGSPVPKQFHDLAGRTILERSVRALADRPGVAGVVVVLAPHEIAGPNAEMVRGWPGVLRVVAGGESRAESVACGLRSSESSPFVLVHDGARPLVSGRLVDEVMEATRLHGAAVPLMAISDTVKAVDASGAVAETVDRSSLRLSQTPQGSRTDWLLQAMSRAQDAGISVTDEAAALELAGRKVAAVPGEARNRKITSIEDLEEAREALRERPGYRVGSGFDIHRLDTARKLVLGGVLFEGETGLAGHSDADVVLHAAMDALLGAAGLGDIGGLFPPQDERWKGADSAALATRVAALVREQGFEIVNIDLTVLAEAPAIGPMAERMRRAIGSCLSIDPGRIGLKATTLEGLGAVGRREGIACQAVALLGGGRGS
jgi:2-C-methyl-D-erythritol 4-phosphate cytidylyltransferase/2-C-methyl-D-erythritol 2,4-cyclodiphosphate synthase